MTLANPLALLWLLLAIPIVWLWLRKAAPPREPVATSMFWEQALAAERLRTAWQRWRRPATLTIRLLALLLLVLALANPRTRTPQRFVLVVDNSASMNAADAEPSRLVAAQEIARKIIDSLCDDDVAAVVSAGSPAAVRCGLTADQSLLRDAVENIQAGSGATEMAAAMDLARRILPAGAGNRVIIVSDGCFPDAAELARGEGVEFLTVGTRAGNIAITRLAARSFPTARSPVLGKEHDLGATGVSPVLEEHGSGATAVSLLEAGAFGPSLCQVLVEVRSFCDRAVKCRLKIGPQEEEIELSVNGRWQAVWEMPVPAGGQITARLASADVSATGSEVSTAVEKDAVRDLALASPGRKASPGRQPGDTESGLASSHPRADARGSPGTDVQELDLRVPKNLGSDPASIVPGPAGPPIWLFLTLAGALLIVVQWCLAERRWMD